MQKYFFKEKRQISSHDTVVIQIDYAENFTLRQQSEIQSAYFQCKQISIFTCVMWLPNAEVQSLAIVSDYDSHNKYSVYACLSAVFKFLVESFPIINHVHIFSDGASSQFKQTFTLTSMSLHAIKFGFVTFDWNFFATSHGKGAVDGIGAIVKSFAWKQIKAKQAVISCAQDFVTALTNRLKVQLIHLTPDDIEFNVEMLDKFWNRIPSIPHLRDYHCFQLLDNELVCKLYSSKDAGVSFLFTSQNVASSLATFKLMQAFKVNDVVLVKYNMQEYPGQITALHCDGISVKFMEKIGPNQWIWPKKDDVFQYSLEEVKKIASSNLKACGTSSRVSHYELSL